MDRLTEAGLEVVVLSNNINSAHYNEERNARYLPQFYSLRCTVFSEAGPLSFVRDAPSIHDIHPDSYTAVLVCRDGRVRGGRKICVHEPGSGTELRTDQRIFDGADAPVPIRDALAHLDIDNVRHAFFSGLCFDQLVRGKGYFREFNRANFAFARDLRSVFVSTQSVPANFVRMLESAFACGAAQIVAMPHQRATSGTFRTFMSFSRDAGLAPAPSAHGPGRAAMTITPEILERLKTTPRDWNALFPDRYSYR